MTGQFITVHHTLPILPGVGMTGLDWLGSGVAVLDFGLLAGLTIAMVPLGGLFSLG